MRKQREKNDEYFILSMSEAAAILTLEKCIAAIGRSKMFQVNVIVCKQFLQSMENALRVYIVHRTHQPASQYSWEHHRYSVCLDGFFSSLTYSSFMPLFNDFAIVLYGHTTQEEKLKAQTKKERVLKEATAAATSPINRSDLIYQLNWRQSLSN